MTLNIWLGQGGKQPLHQKKRALGFVMKMIEAQLAMVNEFCETQRPSYMDKFATLKVYGDATLKPDLVSTPFLVFLLWKEC